MSTTEPITNTDLGATLETSFSFGANHRERCPDGVRQSHLHGNTPAAYLGKFLQMFRPFGYATRDDSWGELEKILDIVHRECGLNRFREASRQLSEARKEMAKIERFCDENLSKSWRSHLTGDA